MAGTIEIPSFRYSGVYYPEIMQDLLVWMRGNVPEITDEDPHEPFIQLLSAFALVGHYNNVLLDVVAQERFLPTARLRESVRMILSGIGYRLRQPSPAVADLVVTLNAPITSSRTIPGKMRFETRSTATDPAIPFETPAAGETIPATNVLTKAWEYVAAGAVWTDRTVALNVDGGSITPWGGTPTAGDCLYFGHSRVEWDRVVLTLPTIGDCWTANGHVWEYKDDHSDAGMPDSVANLGGGSLRFNLATFLGSCDRHGATIRVTCNLTGVHQDVIAAWSGSYNRVDTGFLGQTVPSMQAGDYTITAEWREVDGATTTDITGTTATAKTVDFNLPETVTRDWTRGAVNGTTAFWLRLRIVRTATTSPAIDRAKIDGRRQYLKILGTQGETYLDDPAGSSTGLAGQQIQTANDDVVEGTLVVEVDEGAGWIVWTAVENFLSSSSTARHYTVEFDNYGRATVTFGDGETGKIPTAGTGNIRNGYRSTASANGNVGPNTIVVNASALAIASGVTNPRPAAGWKCRDGADKTDLARVKIAGPEAALRTAGHAITVEDCESMVVNEFEAADGSSPVIRAKGFEEEFGTKTIGLAVVGSGGSAVPIAYLPEIDVYFNGDDVEGIDGVLVLNHELTSRNFTPRAIAVTATIVGGDPIAVAAAVAAYLTPIATKTDGTWTHAFGGTIYRSKIADVIFDSDPDIEDVTISVPATDVALADDELPTAGAIVIT